MARTAVPISALVADGNLAMPAGTAVDPTNGHIISAAGKTDRLFIRCTNTSAGAKNLTVKAGVNPPAQRQGIGDLVVSIAATTGDQLIGPLGSSRFVQADGSIFIDLAAAITGNIFAFRLPKA